MGLVYRGRNLPDAAPVTKAVPFNNAAAIVKDPVNFEKSWSFWDQLYSLYLKINAGV